MGVCPVRSVFLAVVGKLSLCINDLSEILGGREEVAHLVLGNYRGATSELISIEKRHLMTVTWYCMLPLNHLIALATAADVSIKRGLDGDHMRRFFIGYLSSPPAF
jgi:hypothetical protein